MTDRDNPFRSHASPLGFLQRLVPGAPERRPKLEPNDFLKIVHSAPVENTAPRVDDADLGRDPAREAAMNHVRRMRIRAA